MSATCIIYVCHLHVSMSATCIIYVCHLHRPPPTRPPRCTAPGEDFSVSDIAVGAYLLYLPIFFPSMDLSKYPAMWEYMTRLVARPACPAPYQEAMKSESGGPGCRGCCKAGLCCGGGS
jgi:hypothetical protein